MLVTACRQRFSAALVAGTRAVNGAVNNLPTISTPIFSQKFQQAELNKSPLTGALGMRHGGVSILGAGIGLVAIGGCAQGMGQLFAALVVGIARNPSMKEDLFTYTLIGLGFVEFLAIVVLLFSVFLLFSE